MFFIPDAPITNASEDSLNSKIFANNIVKAIRNTNPPFTYGVVGDWGTGKTSLLHLVEDILRKPSIQNKKNRFIPIWFNAWQYENEQNIIFPLLYAIKQQYEKDFPDKAESTSFSHKFSQVAYTSTLALTDIVLRATTKKIIDDAISLEDIKKHLDNLMAEASNVESILSGWANQVKTLQDAFSDLLDTYAKEAERKYSLTENEIKFVIIIDDLDRCLPQTMISILEGIKNFLYSNRCIYILGINPKIVHQGIRAKYSGLEIDGREYLEKILNYVFRLEEMQISIGNFSLREFKKLIDQEKSTNIEYEYYFKIFGTTLEECNFTNPRKIKRILNRFLIYLEYYHSTFSSIEEVMISQTEVAIKLITMAEYFPEIFGLQVMKFDEINKKISSMLNKFSDFDYFEGEFGVNLRGSYYEMLKNKKLFSINTIADAKVIVQRVHKLYQFSTE